MKRLLDRAMRRPWLSLGVTLAALAVGGFGFAVSGVMSLRASSGHWAITTSLLQFAMQRSVATNAMLIKAPPLGHPDQVLRGATHYDGGCSPCHGNVTGRVPRIPQAMLPPPPYLPPRVGAWSDADLFYIVKHGVKFTGMPAWPAQQRDDEVWDVVAFLRRLPGMMPEEYARLTGGGTPLLSDLPEAKPQPAGDAPAVVRERCVRCHGWEGQGRGEAFPTIAGQQPEYLHSVLRAYAEGRRHSGVMGPIAAALTVEEREQAVRHYASSERLVLVRSDAGADAAAGETIASHGVGERIPACVECHGPSTQPRYAAYPRLDGQYADYLVRQLQLLKARRRGGTEFVELMHTFVDQLTDDEIIAVARYYAALGPDGSLGQTQPPPGGREP